MIHSLLRFTHGRWKQQVIEILKPALKVKFEYNEHLQAALLSTGDRMIGEVSSSDTLPSFELSLSSSITLVTSHWKGENIQCFSLSDGSSETTEIKSIVKHQPYIRFQSSFISTYAIVLNHIAEHENELTLCNPIL